MVNKLSEIAEIKSMVERSRLVPAREIFLRRKAIIKMAHSSTSIEGNTLLEYQVKEILDGKKIRAEDDQILEVKNYLAALKQVDEFANAKNHIEKQEILSLHRSVTAKLIEKEKSGKFRKGPVYIVNVGKNRKEKLVYTPPEALSVPRLIDELLDWLVHNSQIHPVIRAGLLHYQFETIHPFTDGNGRTGRLLTLLHLYQSGWSFKKVLVLEDYYNRNREQYYQALQTGRTYRLRKDTDLSGWLEYFIEGFREEARKVKDQILTLSAMEETGITRNVLDNDQLRIVDFVLTMGRITSSDVADILQVPKRTAQAKLKRLEEIKVLEKKGLGPATYYKIPLSPQ